MKIRIHISCYKAICFYFSFKIDALKWLDNNRLVTNFRKEKTEAMLFGTAKQLINDRRLEHIFWRQANKCYKFIQVPGNIPGSKPGHEITS